jgi:apolipoprotein N-acyltransferase
MYFFWALTGFYWIAAFFHSAPDPLFERQAVCSILEWMYLGAFFYLYPATQAREAEATIEAGYSHT